MMENVSYTNVQLKVHVENVCAAFIIIKDKINPRVGISSLTTTGNIFMLISLKSG